MASTPQNTKLGFDNFKTKIGEHYHHSEAPTTNISPRILANKQHFSKENSLYSRQGCRIVFSARKPILCLEICKISPKCDKTPKAAKC